MREILFRGKRKDNGKWVEGAFLHLNVGRDFICDGTVWIGTLQPVKYEVDPETVGQFTGLTDKNGKKIFEGDIVRYVNPDEDVITGRVSYGEHSYSGTHEVGFYVEWQKPEWAMYLRDDLGFWTNFREIEVIGNIHDNPELLED